MREFDVNPIIRTDYPDPDVIRVDDTYYMVSTTMHFLPGGAVLRSYDLIHWEIVNYLFDELDDIPGERLEFESTNYGAGMWAPSLRYYNGTFYVVFVSKGAGKTYLFTSNDILGNFEKKEIEGYYHDCSLLFDDDGRKFIVYGNSDIWLTELRSDLSGPQEGGINKIIVSDEKNLGLGYEGSHFYKINGKYYLFLIHWLQKGNKRRTEACFVADRIDGEYTGRDVLDDDMGFFNNGVAQGGIVDTPFGKWFAVLFRDNGAVGRIPVVVPVSFENDFPVFGIKGKVPINISIPSSRPYYRYEPLFASDDFVYESGEITNPHPVLKKQWQWNHRPDNDLWEIVPEGLKITTGKLCANVTHAKNTLTQRCMYPKCEAEVTVDTTELKEGDVAGICLLQGLYGLVGITKETGDYFLVKIVKGSENYKGRFDEKDYFPGTLVEKIRLDGPKLTLCLKANFEDLQDKLDFFYEKQGRFIKVGQSHTMRFGLDHFCGARFGLFVYSTKKSGGSCLFSNFEYRHNT